MAPPPTIRSASTLHPIAKRYCTGYNCDDFNYGPRVGIGIGIAAVILVLVILSLTVFRRNRARQFLAANQQATMAQQNYTQNHYSTGGNPYAAGGAAMQGGTYGQSPYQNQYGGAQAGYPPTQHQSYFAPPPGPPPAQEEMIDGSPYVPPPGPPPPTYQKDAS